MDPRLQVQVPNVEPQPLSPAVFCDTETLNDSGEAALISAQVSKCLQWMLLPLEKHATLSEMIAEAVLGDKGLRAAAAQYREIKALKS